MPPRAEKDVPGQGCAKEASSVNWKLILLCVSLSVTILWFIGSAASLKTADRLDSAAGTLFKWLLLAFDIGGVIGLLNLGWGHLMK